MKNLILFLVYVMINMDNYAETKQNIKKTEKEQPNTAKVQEGAKQVDIDKLVNRRVEQELNRFKTGNIEEFGHELWKKEKKLLAKEALLKRREDQMTRSEQSLENKIKEFQRQQETILGCLDARDKNKEKRVRYMVQVIAGMRPAAAASVLSVQDENISVKILELLPAPKASRIFNAMDEEVSARLQKQFMSMKK